MLIEFLGVPGSGKTTLSRRVASLLAVRGITVDEPTYDLDHRRAPSRRKIAKLASALRFAMREPRTALTLLRAVRRSRQARMKDALHVSLNNLHIASLASRRHAAPVVTILDQGLAQAAWSIAYSARDPAWRDLVRRIPEHTRTAPDLVVLVKADPRQVGTRLKARARRASRMDHLGSRDAALQCAQSDCDAIAVMLRAHGATVMEVTNNSPHELTMACAAICAAIRAERDATDGATEAVKLAQITDPSHESDRIAIMPFDPRHTSRESGT